MPPSRWAAPNTPLPSSSDRTLIGVMGGESPIAVRWVVHVLAYV